MARPISRRGTFAEQPEIYGYSADQTPLTFWPATRSKVDILIFAGIHGEEPDSTVLLSRALRSSGRPSPSCAAVVCANPDGLRNGTRGNANGVDLNRNFPSRNWRAEPVMHKWHFDGDRRVELSPGTAPASEPEVRALIELITRFEPECVVSIHSPLGLIDDPDGTELGQALAEQSGLARSVIPTHTTPGSFGSWAGDVGLTSITYELPHVALGDMLRVHVPILQTLLEKGLAMADRAPR